jgi:hypothetical protein
MDGERGMVTITIGCARCTQSNHPSDRFCSLCGLPLGSAEPDSAASLDALGPYEAPDPAELGAEAAVRDFVKRSGFPGGPAGHGWRLVVPARPDRKQAVYVGAAGIDPDDRPILTLVSVCGTANARDTRTLMMMNAQVVEGHFAIRVLRGEEYYVVVHNIPAVLAPSLDAERVILRIAATADRMEERLSRGRDIY